MVSLCLLAPGVVPCFNLFMRNPLNKIWFGLKNADQVADKIWKNIVPQFIYKMVGKFYLIPENIKRRLYPVSAVPIEKKGKHKTIVDNYWGEHTVYSDEFESAYQSRKYLEWRAKEYPKFIELMELYGDHEGETILDYGCGPANDSVGFALWSNAKKIIGIDVSSKALKIAQHRLWLHRLSPERIRLIKSSDSSYKIPLKDESVNYIYSEGVIHHTSNQSGILKEFYRILQHGGVTAIMVYNYDSVWVHLYVAYLQMIKEKAYPDNFTVRQVFTKTSDGPNCPIADCYKPAEFEKMGRDAGFKTE